MSPFISRYQRESYQFTWYKTSI